MVEVANILGLCVLLMADPFQRAKSVPEPIDAPCARA
jgi:hypothetical protein